MAARGTCVARSLARFAAPALLILLSSCASALVPAPPPPGEWTPAAAQPPSEQAELYAYSWKGIEPGRTTRAEVDKRFKPRPQGSELAYLYRVDQIDTTISYDRAQKVVSIRLPPASPLSPGE